MYMCAEYLWPTIIHWSDGLEQVYILCFISNYRDSDNCVAIVSQYRLWSTYLKQYLIKYQ